MTDGRRRKADVVMEAAKWELAPRLPAEGLARA
jgi:hypothetical protein